MPGKYPLSQAFPTTADNETEILPFATFEIDEATGDLAIPLTIVRGVRAILLRLRSRLRFFKGEWFLDLRLGFPYIEAVLVKNPDIYLVQAIFRQVILGTPGVLKIVKMNTSFDRANRVFSITDLEIVITGGIVYRLQSEDFIVSMPPLEQ